MTSQNGRFNTDKFTLDSFRDIGRTHFTVSFSTSFFLRWYESGSDFGQQLEIYKVRVTENGWTYLYLSVSMDTVDIHSVHFQGEAIYTWPFIFLPGYKLLRVHSHSPKLLERSLFVTRTGKIFTTCLIKFFFFIYKGKKKSFGECFDGHIHSSVYFIVYASFDLKRVTLSKSNPPQ